MVTLSDLDLEKTIAQIYRLARDYTADVKPLRWDSILAIFNAVKSLPYRRDETAPECGGAAECVKRPALTLALGGDCDDKAVLAGSALSLLGVPWRVVTTSYSPDGEMSHVYLEVLITGKWFPFDATHADNRLGEEAPFYQKAWW